LNAWNDAVKGRLEDIAATSDSSFVARARTSTPVDLVDRTDQVIAYKIAYKTAVDQRGVTAELWG
jgi:hypothetical protein